MSKALNKLIDAKKKKGEVGDVEKYAKMGVLQELQGLTNKAMLSKAKAKEGDAKGMGSDTSGEDIDTADVEDKAHTISGEEQHHRSDIESKDLFASDKKGESNAEAAFKTIAEQEKAEGEDEGHSSVHRTELLEDSPAEESIETPEHEAEEGDMYKSMSPDELEKHLAMVLKARLAHKK